MIVSKEPIRAFNTKIIGWLETDDKGNQIASNFSGKMLGKYDKVCDCTRDFTGKILTKGNTVVGLILKDALN